MLNEIKEIIKRSLKEGIRLPFAFDAASKQPSVTLLFVYIAFIMALIGLTLVLVKDIPSTGAMFTIGFFVICMVFYRMRALDKVRIDLDDKEIELDGDDGSSEKNN